MSSERMQCHGCGHSYVYLRDLDEHIDAQIANGELAASVTSQTTEMAVELSADVDRLEEELRHWKRAFVRLASKLESEAQIEAALLVAELDEKTTARVLEVASAIRNGTHPWGR